MKHIKKFEEVQDEMYIEYHDIDDILKAYLECALWTEEENDDLESKTIYDITEKSKKEAIEQIEWFVDSAGEALNNIEDSSIGYDLWLTRNGHGAGFFDKNYDKDIIDFLLFLCDELGEAYLHVIDDKFEINTYGNYKEVDIEEHKKDMKFKRDLKKYNL